METFDSTWWTGKGMPQERMPYRPLWVYAVDPTLAYELSTSDIHRAMLKIRWENEDLKPGPVGEYLEVIDYDPASRCFYPPVDLNEREILALGGLPPSEGNPQFHQQMVYAVAMFTIQTFERALGRRSLWARRRGAEAENDKWHGYVKRLRIYPHALRDQNAYCDPEKKALLFGYFPAVDDSSSTTMPGGTVFTCLSFDIVAHETTHALLDGLHPYFTEPSNIDVFAFHEAFADIVALFQHFSMQDLLAHQIAKTRGDLGSQNLLGELAQQFGQATGRHGALRSAIGETDPETKAWRPYRVTGRELEGATEPHARGAVLVAAVFDAFVSIYRRRTADLVRIASDGTGLLRQGTLPPDLANRLAHEASKAAGQVLNICVRALDYCPPVDITFGDYLQALITADYDLVPDDTLGYRVAFIEAFRRRGIYPHSVRTLSENSLRWTTPTANLPRKEMEGLSDFLKRTTMRAKRGTIMWDMRDLLAKLEATMRPLIVADPHLAELLGIRSDWPFEIESARPSYREGPDGEGLRELTFDVLQGVHLPFDRHDETETPIDDDGRTPVPDSSFVFRGGSTVVLDLEEGRLRYCISKSITSAPRRAAQREFLIDREGSLQSMYFGAAGAQPFAMLHRSREVI